MIIGVAAQPLLSFSAEVSDSSHVVALDEVVVVSHPKEHVLLRNLPLSSTMIGAEQIDMRGFNSLDKLSEQELLGLIRQLPIGYRTVFNLYAIEGKSHQEIGELLNIKADSSASQYHRAKNMLAKMANALTHKAKQQ